MGIVIYNHGIVYLAFDLKSAVSATESGNTCGNGIKGKTVIQSCGNDRKGIEHIVFT